MITVLGTVLLISGVCALTSHGLQGLALSLSGLSSCCYCQPLVLGNSCNSVWAVMVSPGTRVLGQTFLIVLDIVLCVV